MGHVSTLEMTKEEWQAKRLSTIGSSDVGTILGLNRYKTRLELWKEKKGLIPPFEGNDSTEWGTELEDFCALMFERKEMGEGKLPGRVQRDNKIRVHGIYPWATCNLDRLIVGGKEPIILELKTTTSFAVKNWDAAIPTSYYAQLQWQMYVTGYGKAIIWVAVLDKKQFIRLDVEYSDEFVSEMVEQAKAFIKAVENGEAPAPELADVEKMKPASGTKIEATDNVLAQITALNTVKAQIAELQSTEKKLAAELKLFMGENEALVQGERVLATYRTQHKDAYSVPASDYRVFNLQREKKGKNQ